ncbi:hypothetical protein ACFFV7_38400 [Nonomuraea spiralis]|uniref:NACHT N-terminal Helical domain-containing protein n=1 Tax=Nonomuraea spiralis TaxID=46182 RepID=A0ABV5IRE0_9ACTN
MPRTDVHRRGAERRPRRTGRTPRCRRDRPSGAPVTLRDHGARRPPEDRLALSLFDAKGEPARLSRQVGAGLSDRLRGLGRFSRTQRIAVR